MTILVITTGGTIGALAYPNPVHPPEFSTLPGDGRDFVIDALAKPAFKKYQTRGLPLEPRDSKLIDQAYLDHMLQQIAEAAEQQILITHGTDRILDTAKFFYRQIEQGHAALRAKIIILTGAMTPLANGPISDGYQNILFGLSQLATGKLTKSQIYIVLSDHANGQWQPLLYPFKPGLYHKVYTEDGRYHRLQKTG